MAPRRLAWLALMVSTVSCGAPMEGAGDGSGPGSESVGTQQEALSLPPSIKALSETAATLSGYYSKAKSAYDVVTFLGQALGFLQKDDPNAKFNEIKNTVLQSATAVDWKSTTLFIDGLRGDAV